MKFMITFNHADGVWERLDEEAREAHSEWLTAFMLELKEEKDSELVFLSPPSRAHTVRKYPDGSKSVEEGVAVPGNEFMGGYYIIEAESLEEALDWAKRGRELIGSNEVREIIEMS